MNRMFVSYPKSGRTWIRFVLHELEVDQFIGFHHDQFEFNDAARPPHCFDLNSRLEKYSGVDKLVYLERDPRAVIVSLYHQVTGRFSDFFHYKGNLSAFIRDDYFGASNLARFRAMWAEICQAKGFMRISYESCHADLMQVIVSLLDYYEFDVSRSVLSDVIGRASFNSMRDMEQAGEFAHPWLRLRNGAPKVRKGRIDGFLDELSPDDLEYLNGIFETALV